MARPEVGPESWRPWVLWEPLASSALRRGAGDPMTAMFAAVVDPSVTLGVIPGAEGADPARCTACLLGLDEFREQATPRKAYEVEPRC